MVTTTPDHPDSNELVHSHVITATDGTGLHLKEWVSASASKNAVLIMHGITGYSGPYEVIGKPVANLGVTAYGHDLRGHGQSGGNRGDVKSVDQFRDDMKAVLDFILSRHEGVIFVGHSLGIVTTLMTLEYFPDNISGLVLLSGGRTLREGAYPKRSLLSKLKILLWSILKPSKPVIHYYREGILGIDDPMFTFYYTLRFLRTFNAENIVIPSKIDYPVFVGVGDKDELFEEETCRSLLEEFEANDKHFALFPDTYHSRFHGHSFDELFTWIKERYA